MSDGKEVNRRDALKLASGAVALGAALGIPRAALALAAEGAPAYEFYLKIYKMSSGTPMQSIRLSEDVARAMVESPATMHLKLWRSPSEAVGQLPIPAEVQARLRAPIMKDTLRR